MSLNSLQNKLHCLSALFSVFLLLSVPLFIGYSTSFASAKKPSGASSSGGGNNTGQTGGNNGASTGSTNQQQCPNGEHFDNKKNKCVKDTSKQQGQAGTNSTHNATTAVTCAGETHLDTKTGQCVSNSIPLPDGSCVAGWQISPQNDCTKIPSTPSTQSNNNSGTGGSGASGLKTLFGPPIGGGVLLLPYFHVCPKGTHYDQKYDKCLDKNGLVAPFECPAETHANALINKCEPDSVELPLGLDPNHNGGCSLGFQKDMVLDPTGHTCFPETTSGTSTPSTPSSQSNNTGTGGGGNGTTTGGNKSSTITPSPHTQSNKTSTTTTGGNKSSTITPSPHTQSNKTSTNTNTVINQNTVRNQAAGVVASSPSINTGPSYTQTPSMSMWSLSLGKSTFAKEGLRLLANLKPFGTIGVPYTLDISFNLPSTNVSLIAAQLTKAGLQHAVIIPINKTAEGAAGESLYQAELGQTITGINPFTKHPDAISGGGATDLLLFNNGNSDIVFNDDSGATMTLRYR